MKNAKEFDFNKKKPISQQFKIKNPPEMKKEKAVIIAVAIAALLSIAFTYAPILNKVSVGISISICAIVSAAIVAIIKPIENSENAEGGTV